MPSRPDEQVPARPGRSPILMNLGLLLAAAATVAAFLTDDPVRLRLAVVAGAWGVVVASLSATRRRAEQQAALAREVELRRAYERELDLEVAARRQFELELENDLRQETERAVRREMGGLRADIAALDRVRGELSRTTELADDLSSLSDLRAEVASLAALRAEVVSLSSMRGDVAALASLRNDVVALGALREDLGQLAGLRADMSRLRDEIVEQLDVEMLVERIVMRSQATPHLAELATGTGSTVAADVLGIAGEWSDEAPDLPASWPAFRLDDPAPMTSEYEYVRPLRAPVPAPTSVEPRTAAFSLVPCTPSLPAVEGRADRAARTPLEWLANRSLVDSGEVSSPGRRRHSAAEPELWSEPPAPPLSYGAARAVAEDCVLPVRPVPYRRRRTDDGLGVDVDGPRTDPAEAITTVRPRPAAARPPLPTYGTPPFDPGTEADGHVRLSEILAENGGGPPSGRGRQRRYREDGDPDDVLSRVLGER